MGIRLALLATLAAAAPAAASEVDQPARSTTIAARGSVLAYSAWDDALGAYRLRVSAHGNPPADVPVPPRAVPFDVHVGQATEPDGSRRIVLVYSRCAKEPPPLSSVFPEQLWRAARGCSLRVTGLDGHERAILGAGGGVLPGVSGRTLAFVRFRPGVRPRVIVRRFDGEGPPRRVIRLRRGTPVDLDVLGQRLALTRRYVGGGEVENSALDIVDLRSGARRRVRTRKGGGLTAHGIVGASLLPHGTVAWAEICGGDFEGCPHTERLARWSPRTGLRSVEDDEGVEAFAATPFATWLLDGCSPGSYVDGGPCVLVRR